MDPKPGQNYKHYKNKKLYEIVCIALDRETKEKLVVYKGLYDCPEFGKNPIWTRFLSNFIEIKEIDGKKIPRFELVE